MNIWTSRCRPFGQCSGHAVRCGLVLVIAWLVSHTSGRSSEVDNWPTYRHDNARSGVTAASLQLPLVPCWVYQPLHRPAPAWGEPNPRPVGGWYGLTEGRRVHFDDAFHVVVADGTVYWGSSADGRVVALEAAGGEQRWCALTEGPVRLAPTVWEDKVYVGSDDGFVYCLRADDGTVVWKFPAAPDRRKVLGSSKMISLWPVRTGVLVDQGVAYFGAGIFPAEGVYMYAVDAQDGRLIWCNDSGGAAPQSRFSPQGYLLASKDRLFVPLGRVSPAALDRQEGRLLYESYIEHIIGGTNATLDEDQLYTGTEQIIGYDQASHRNHSSWFWSQQLVVTSDDFYGATGSELFAVRRGVYSEASLRRKSLLDQRRDLTSKLESAKRSSSAQTEPIQQQLDAVNQEIKAAEGEMVAGELWRVSSDCEESLLVAGPALLAGGNGHVEARDAQSGQLLWTADIDGKARGLAVAEGRLFVSTDSGTIHCFGPTGSPQVGTVEQPVTRSADPADELTELLARAADYIIATTGIQRGYCLVLGCGTGRLASELARRTELQICAVEPDEERARAARRMLAESGLYGARVVVEHADLSQIPCSDYFANLIVSEEAITSGRMPAAASDAIRLLKPLGGKICIGQPAAAHAAAASLPASAAQSWLAEAGLEGGEISQDDGVWLHYERGPLPGAGSWTHQYAEPGNSTCSDDQLVRGPLSVLWFGYPGPEQMAERHRRAVAPLAVNGRVFVLGEGTANRIGAGANSVMAFDAYNGLPLWERQIRGALRVSVTHDAGNMAATDDSLFVAVDNECWQLAAATGETIRTLPAPTPPRSHAAFLGLGRGGRRRALRIPHDQGTHGRLRLRL
jgi:outer membrane protein assembly factor BamB